MSTASIADHVKNAGSGFVGEQPDLRQIMKRVTPLLPTQGPIEVFVYLNPLEAFEGMPFHDGVLAAQRVYGGNPYFPESKYRELLTAGRITTADLEAVLREELGEQDDDRIDALGTRLQLRMAMLRHPLHVGPDAELKWVVAETDALDRFRHEVPVRVRERTLADTREWFTERLTGAAEDPSCSDEQFRELTDDMFSRYGRRLSRWRERRWEAVSLQLLWRVCRQGVEDVSAGHPPQERLLTPREILLKATGEDINRYVHDVLIRLCGAFLDQGYADWKMPHRDRGLYHAFLSLYSQHRSVPEQWTRDLRDELLTLQRENTSAEESIEESLDILGVAAADREEFITQTLLSLRGWAGMIWQLENAPGWVVRPAPKGSIVDYLAIQLILERQAIAYIGREVLGVSGPISRVVAEAAALIPEPRPLNVERRAFLLFQVGQMLGWQPRVLLSLTRQQWAQLVSEFENFSALERRRVFHEAYERRYRVAALDAFEIHSRRRRRLREKSTADTFQPPTFQIMTCIDDREESFRRHIEEVAPECETFAAAGFFAVAMNYKGATDSFYKPLCPVVIDPVHYVQEDVGYTFEGMHHSRAQLRNRLGWATYLFHTRSRTFIGGVFTGIAGSLATVPLVARVLFPHLTSRIRSRVGALLKPPPVTRLQLLRHQETPGPNNGHVGYTLQEMAGIVERLLQDIGLIETEKFSRLFVVCGHGSSSLNNPHESAYCCGACAGKRGGPNARAFAEMANDWRVRAMLDERGLHIPEDTVFVGAYHNTCDDSVVYYDLDRLPASHRTDFEVARTAIDDARRRNAHERCRRFVSAPLTLTADEALRHVESRSQDLAQVRPEYDHATNALCIVGRREWTRGLFLDRRAFLSSYDPGQDDEQSSILLRILAAAIPVCSGINLQFYFSTVDNVRYGAGSKLPHNLASLLGVMEGSSSDLRTGVYAQVTEIHEPLRLLFVIETTTQAMLSIMDRNAVIGRLCRGGWVQLAVIDAETSTIELFRNGRFEPYEASTDQLGEAVSSLECYAGSRGHLRFQSIEETEVE
ncbi:MAG: DUF2309 domain-containing protein [Planctomycetaceae bacterium]